jgi:CHAD domain-containing protein
VLQAWSRAPLEPLPLAIAGEEEGIHDLRVAARRLRAALPILLRKPGRTRVRETVKLLRRVGDLAGSARDYDVIWPLLSRRAAQPGVPALLERLRAARAQARRDLAEGLAGLDAEGVRDVVGSAASEIPEQLFVVLARFARRRDELAADIFRRLQASRRFAPDALHRLRIRVRRLRYLAEMYWQIRGIAPSASQLKALQDALGALQDAWVLTRWLRREAALARRRGDTALSRDAAREARFWGDAAREQHRRFRESDAAERLRSAVLALGSSKRAGVHAHFAPPGSAPHRRKHARSA